MIGFRCWYCNRGYLVDESRIGTRRTCGCGSPLRVPNRDGGNSRCRSLLDWAIEIAVYGGGGALLGLCLALLIVRFSGGMALRNAFGIWQLMGLCILSGFAAGAAMGESGIIWIGRFIRKNQE